MNGRAGKGRRGKGKVERECESNGRRQLLAFSAEQIKFEWLKRARQSERQRD